MRVHIRRFLGELSLAEDDQAAAWRWLQDSLELADACVVPFERALTLLEIARLRIAEGDRGEARQLLAEVREICEPLEARTALDRVPALQAELEAVDGLRSARRGRIGRVRRKGGTERTVFLSKDARQARQDLRRNVAAVFVLQDLVEERIAGYYTLSATAIEPTALPDELARRLPHYPTLPAVLLGRLAVDARYRGQGLGALLLLDALGRALTHSRQIAALAVIVDAKDEAAVTFYRRYGFQLVVGDPRRLFLPMQTVAEVLAAAE